VVLFGVAYTAPPVSSATTRIESAERTFDGAGKKVIAQSAIGGKTVAPTAPITALRDPGRLSRVEMNALRAPLTVFPDLRGDVCKFFA